MTQADRTEPLAPRTSQRTDVLLLEDDDGVREGMAELLAELGTVRAVASVDEALAALQERHFRVVLTDLRIGSERGAGVRVARVAQQAGIPVVICSAMTGSEILNTLGSLKPEGILAKPFPIEEALALVRRLIR